MASRRRNISIINVSISCIYDINIPGSEVLLWMLWVDMASVATQTVNETNISSMMDSLTTQVSNLLSEMEHVRGLTGDRQTKLDTLERAIDNSERATAEMDAVTDHLERELLAAEDELSQLDKAYKELLEEQDKLDEAGHQLYQKVSIQDQYLQEVKTTDKQLDLELTRARFLRDEMRNEFCKKEEELSIARERLDEQNMEFFKQFEGLKYDVKRQRQEAQPLLEELESCDKMTLTRIKSFLKSDNISPGDLERTEKLKKFLEYMSRYRQVFDKVGDLEFEARNSEKTMEFSQSQIKAKLAKMECLEKELSDTLGVFGETNGHYLKRAPRCVDLALNHDIRQEMETACWSEDEEEEVETRGEFLHVGGIGLHRCVKVTNIRLQFEEKGTEDESTVQEVEEEDRQEESLDKKDEKDETEDEKNSKDTDTMVEAHTEKIDMAKALAAKAAAAREDDEASSSRSPSNFPTSLTMEGVSATEKHISSITHRGDLSLSRDSRSSFVKPSHRVELRATGSSAAYKPSPTSGRKQKR